ncbi:hypothetical protein GCM10007071_02470 [Marinobacter zhanjiangensis]|uniref:Uncharacterized protein n=1 Tax=Marinobacter zhanjiangensis TaxID=578215 RepID=A0ABQ3APG5_9GAMM|nr:hypothetical protein GCM10007071_02470 [Marinobacter zhanjiangensis]
MAVAGQRNQVSEFGRGNGFGVPFTIAFDGLLTVAYVFRALDAGIHKRQSAPDTAR